MQFGLWPYHSLQSCLNIMATDATQRRRHFFPRRDGPLLEEGGKKDCRFKGVEKGPSFQSV